VSLEDTETACRNISKEAVKAKEGLSQVPECPAVVHLSDRVERVNEEAEFAMVLVQNARKELEKSLQWSCTKTKVKSDEWFGAWGQLLDQILNALGRAQPAISEAPQAGEVECSILREKHSLGGSVANRRQSSAGRRQSNCGVPTNLVPGVKVGNHAPPKARPPSKPPVKQGTMLDDAARAESLEFNSVQPIKSTKPSLFVGFDEKENSGR